MVARVTDVELVKKQVRKMAAGRVLAGGGADVYLDLGRSGDCQVRVCAAYGPLTQTPQPLPHDRLIWVLDGLVEVHLAGGTLTTVSQGESVTLSGGTAYRLVFPQLSIYLSVEGGGSS